MTKQSRATFSSGRGGTRINLSGGILRMAVGGSVLAGAVTAPACQDEPQTQTDMCRFDKRIEIASGELTRETGNPWTKVTVEVPESGMYELLLDNSGMAGFGVYTLDGATVISPDLWSSHESLWSWAGQLVAGTYSLRVRLAGRPGTRVHYTLSRVVSGDGPSQETAFTINEGEAQRVSICGGLSALHFHEDSLATGDGSVDFVATCTARECVETSLASDLVEVTRSDGTGYVFDNPPVIEHPRVPHSVRNLDETIIDTAEGESVLVNGEQLVVGRALIAHFSHVSDHHPCGEGIPIFDIPFSGMREISHGNNSQVCTGSVCTHQGALGEYAVDFGLEVGHPVLAVTDGDLYWRPGGGDYGQSHLLLEVGPSLYYRYAHCSQPSDLVVKRGLEADGPAVAVKAGEVVCLSGEDGPFVDGPHLHADLVSIDDIDGHPEGGESQPHGYVGVTHGPVNDPVNPAMPVAFCPTNGSTDCSGDNVSLQDECISPGSNSGEGTWTRVERIAAASCAEQASDALESGALFSDLAAQPDHPANQLRLHPATNQIYVGSPKPDCGFRAGDAQSRIETAKVLLAGAAGDSAAVLAELEGFFEGAPSCQLELQQEFADYDEIANHWGRDIFAFTARACDQPVAFFEGRLHEDGKRYGDLDEPIVATEAAKLLVEIGRHEVIQINETEFLVPERLRDLYVTYESMAGGEGSSIFLDNQDENAWYVDYVDALGAEYVQCPDPLGNFGVLDENGDAREMTRGEFAAWLQRVLLLSVDERSCS